MVKPKKDDFWSEVHAQRINQDQRLRYHLVCLQWGFVDIRQLASNPVKKLLNNQDFQYPSADLQVNVTYKEMLNRTLRDYVLPKLLIKT